MRAGLRHVINQLTPGRGRGWPPHREDGGFRVKGLPNNDDEEEGNTDLACPDDGQEVLPVSTFLVRLCISNIEQ